MFTRNHFFAAAAAAFTALSSAFGSAKTAIDNAGAEIRRLPSLSPKKYRRGGKHNPKSSKSVNGRRTRVRGHTKKKPWRKSSAGKKAARAARRAA